MKTKRLLSAVLALLLVCGLPVSAFAADFPDNPSNGDVAEIGTGKTMDKNDGIVHSNNGTVTTNNGTVTTNNGTVQNNESKVTTNNGTVVTNNGAVFANINTVVTNNGSVSNNGTEDNNVNAKVTTNNNTVVTNNGTVGTNNGTVTTNNGSIDINNGTVETNNYYVYHNNGTVETNDGTVRTNENSGTVTTNNGYVDHNSGTVETNNATVDANNGTVETNNATGTVTNLRNGTVTTNYGTVTEADGTTHYGLQVDNDGYITLEQKNAGEIWDLAQLFTKGGYVLTGYTQAYQTGENGLTQASTNVEGTSYTADCPNVLTLIWKAIVNPVSDDGTGSFGPGSVISINGHQYLLVAVVEDVYCLASVDSFEAEALSDLPALLASLLTEDQLTHVTGQPELLDEALTARFFGGQGSHIVFPCDSGLIFS